MQVENNSESISNHFMNLKSFLLSNKKPIIITSHKQADPDALGSAIVIYELFNLLLNSDSMQSEEEKFEIKILLPTQSKLTERIISYYKLEKMVLKELLDVKLPMNYCVTLVDTNQPLITDLELIFKNFDSKDIWNTLTSTIIIDHHLVQDQERKTADIEIINIEYSSASELALDLLLESRIEGHDKQILLIGFYGILFDTKRLQLANAATLAKVSYLLNILGGTIEDYLFLLDNEKEYSERVATIKAGQRNKIVILKEKFLLSLSFVSSFESSAARSLLYLGSDIVAIINRGKKEVRISFRAQKKFFDETGLHCGKIASYIAETYSGTGSGHTTAAGCNIPSTNTNNELFEAITNFISRYIESS
jgi:nanoRNase/pAp phosphatase (c-di-AMP/oligoRNAs hydrolase)